MPGRWGEQEGVGGGPPISNWADWERVVPIVEIAFIFQVPVGGDVWGTTGFIKGPGS